MDCERLVHFLSSSYLSYLADKRGKRSTVRRCRMSEYVKETTGRVVTSLSSSDGIGKQKGSSSNEQQ